MHPKSEETQKGAFSSTGSRPSLRVVVRRERVMPFPGIGAKVAGPKKIAPLSDDPMFSDESG